jgi:hypothetical protein
VLFLSSAYFARQLDYRQPEIIDALYNIEKALEVHGLSDIAVRMEQITLQDIGVRCRGS